MKLVLLGTGGYYTNDRRHTACLMLPEVGVVLDAGNAMFRVREYLATDRLDIFLTHVHLDHVIGLTYLLDVLPAEILDATTVYGEPQKLAAVREHLFAKELFPVAPPFCFEAIRNPCPLPQHGTLRHFPLKHPGGSLGFRLDWPGSSLAYVTDTTAMPDSDYIDNIRDVDLLIHEAYFADHADDKAELTGHSCVTRVAEVAVAAQVGCLILVHIGPQLASDDDFNLDRVRRIFKETHLGIDRMEVDF